MSAFRYRRLWPLLLVVFGIACDDSGPSETGGDLRQGQGSDRGPFVIEGDALATDGGRLNDRRDDELRLLDGLGPQGDLRQIIVPAEGVLRISPDQVTVPLGAGMPGTVRFVVSREVQDGASVEVPSAQIVWAVEPAGLGDLDGATGTFTARMLGDGFVRASHGIDTLSANVRVVDIGEVFEPGTPPDAADRFENAPAGVDCAPTWRYPEPLTAIPANLTGLTFQWDSHGHDLFRLSFEVGELTVLWFTNDDTLTPNDDVWKVLTTAAAGGELRVTLRGLGGAGASACEGTTLPLRVDRAPMVGAIYYWSTSEAGIMRIPIGEKQPEHFLTPRTAPQVACPACHALSRDGTRIAVTRTTFPPFGELYVAPTLTPTQPYFNPAGHVSYFPSFNPRGDRLVGGSGGQLVVTNVEDGALIERLPMPANRVGGSPDWDWREDKIVAALGDSGLFNPIPDVGISQGRIAQWVKNGDVWEGPEILVERQDDEGNDRPAFSPDGRFIAFHRTGVAQNMGQAMGNASNSLWLIPSAGGQMPTELVAANQAVGMGNSWPKWAPTSGGGRLWLAFSSIRDYGHILDQDQASVCLDPPECSRTGADARPQLWITGIDPNAPPGSDPSAPAFWLPYQDLDSGNHIPYWAVYVKR